MSGPALFVDYLRELARLQSAKTPARPPRVVYFRELARLATQLKASHDVEAEQGLTLFRELVMARPQDLRRRLLGANLQRRLRLSEPQQHALETLGVEPDLLSPLGELRYEPSYSRLLAWLLRPHSSSRLSSDLLRAFLSLVDKSMVGARDPSVLRHCVVTAEYGIQNGRLDVRISSSAFLVFVEVKVDAAEGHMQLARYAKTLETARAGRPGYLVYLTRAPSDGTTSVVEVAFADLLVAWLPLAHPCGGTGVEGFLARYLKSIALVLGLAGRGSFDHWSFAQQHVALEFVSRI